MSRRCIKLALFGTHPIQYQLPWFRALAAESALDVQVYYAMLPDATQQGAGFGVEFEWDLPLLDGYPWHLLENRSARPALETFSGCDVRNITKVLRQVWPDVALITGWNSLYLVQALIACRRLGIPTLVRGDSNVLAPRDPMKRWLQRMLFSRYSAFLAVGKANRQLYEQAGIVDERIFFCPHFVDNERFARAADTLRAERRGLRQRWGIPEEAACFVFVGKLIRKKRIMDFLWAIEAASRQGAPVFGLVVGEGEQMSEARSFVDSRRVPVTFAGFLNQTKIATVYVAADCLVLPSNHGETWGLVVNEAMACGIPAIVSDQVGCGPDLIVDDQTGKMFPMGDVGGLTDAIALLAGDRNTLETKGKAARDLVMKEYSMVRGVEGVKVAANWILAQRGST